MGRGKETLLCVWRGEVRLLIQSLSLSPQSLEELLLVRKTAIFCQHSVYNSLFVMSSLSLQKDKITSLWILKN